MTQITKNNQQPVVSVVVLTYNQEQTVARTLDSILGQQTIHGYEIIIGEDCSTDGTRAICERYATQYPEVVTLMPAAINKGLLKNYRDCLAECRGHYVACCAGDDWWHNSEKLQMQVDYLNANTQCALVYTNYNIFQAKSKQTLPNALPEASFDTSGIIDKLLRGFFLPSLTIMYRTTDLKYIHFDRYMQRNYRAEDLPMFLEFALHGTLDCINISTATYTAQAGSLSHFDDAAQMEAFMLNMREIKLDFVTDHPDASSVDKPQLVETYNWLIFTGAFALRNTAVARKYYRQLKTKTTKDRLKYTLLNVRPVLWLYTKIRS